VELRGFEGEGRRRRWEVEGRRREVEVVGEERKNKGEVSIFLPVKYRPATFFMNDLLYLFPSLPPVLLLIVLLSSINQSIVMWHPSMADFAMDKSKRVASLTHGLHKKGLSAIKAGGAKMVQFEALYSGLHYMVLGG